MNEFTSSLSSSSLGGQQAPPQWPLQQRRGSMRNSNNNEEEQEVSLIRNNIHQSNNINNKNIDLIKVCAAAKDENYTDYTFYYHFLLTYGPIGTSVTLFWRGMWMIQDMYLFPTDLVKSASTSLLLGIVTGIICHCISQYDLKKQWHHGSTTMSHLIYGIVERCFSFLVAFGAVSYWRGVWTLWDQLVFVNNPVTQNWMSLIVGSVVLLCLRSFRCTFAPPMVYMPDDADHLDGLTLELCDNLWWEKSTIPSHFRRKLTKRHFNQVANYVEWKQQREKVAVH